MSFKPLSPLLAVSVLAVSTVPAWGESEFPIDLSFSCQVENGIPVTVVQGEGSQQSIFHWDSANLPESIDSEVVCNEVAIKLDSHVVTESDMTNLKFIGSQQGGLPAICATQDARECSVLLLTLAPTEKPPETARLFLSSIIDKDLTADRVELNDRGFQSTVYPANLWTLVLGRKFLK